MQLLMQKVKSNISTLQLLYHELLSLLSNTTVPVPRPTRDDVIKHAKGLLLLGGHGLEQWFSTWGPRTPKWSANDFKGAARSKGSARGPPKC